MGATHSLKLVAHSNNEHHRRSWQHRRRLLTKEILHWLPDVVALQEVEHYADIERDLAEEG